MVMFLTRLWLKTGIDLHENEGKDMSASLTIVWDDINRSAWMPQSGTFEEILDLIADDLELINSSLAASLRDIGYCTYGSIENLSNEEFESFLTLVEKVFHRLISEKFSTFLSVGNAFSQLKALLRVDPRINNPIYYRTVNIQIGNSGIWRVEAWIIDLVLERLIEFTVNWFKNDSLSQQLLLQYLDPETAGYDFTAISKLEFCQILNIVDRFVHDFKECDKGTLAYSNRYNPVLCQRIPELFQIMKDDLRGKNCVE